MKGVALILLCAVALGQTGQQQKTSNDKTCVCTDSNVAAACALYLFQGEQFKHENCNQFYKCVNGTAVPYFCPANLIYYHWENKCDWPVNGECGSRPIVDITPCHEEADQQIPEVAPELAPEPDSEDKDSVPGNYNPSKAPGICAVNSSHGTLVAHENCNQFYKCVNGAPVAISCPLGLLYNPYLEVCDWSDNVDCENRPIFECGNGYGTGDNGNINGENGSNGGTCHCNPSEAPGICAAQGSEGTLVANENCNQFYKCHNSIPVTIFCPAGLVYNPYIECCDWPQNVECGDKPVVEIDGGNNVNENGDNGSGVNGNGNGDNGSNGSTCNCNPSEASGICAAEGSDGILVASENCYQFYKCDNGAPVTISCPIGLVYNPYSKVCDWPENVECGERPIVGVDGGNNGNGNCDSSKGNGYEDSGSGDKDNGNGDNGSNSGSCTCNPSEAPVICAAKGSGRTLVAHENCNQFYTCDNGAPVTISCPAGLVYNPYIEVCDWPENVECGDRPIVEVDVGDNGNGHKGNGNGNADSVSGDNENGNGDNGTNGGTCNCNPSEAPEICAADGSDGTLIANENCNQFYTCVDGARVIISCPAGLLYNPYNEICDYPENVECGNRPIVEVNGGNNGNGENGDNNGSNGNSDNDNNGNGENDNGNGDHGSNVGSSNCYPGEAPAICATGESEGVFIAHEECNKFYKCSFGKPVAFSCPGGLYYNPHLEICDWSWRVECDERVILEEGIDIKGNNNGAEDQSEHVNVIVGQNEGNKDPSQAPAICSAEGSNGVLVAHKECNKFSVCSNGSVVVLDCPSNLLYNPRIEYCDWPMNVDCGNRVIPEAVLPESDSSTCLCSSRQAPSICAGSDSNGKMIAHDSCAHYYVCFNGKPIVRSCPLGLYYEPVSRQCNTAVSCEGRRVLSTFSFNKHMEARRGFF